MKKYTHLIRLIVITAGLIGLTVLAFKYIQTNNDATTTINSYASLEKETQNDSIS